MQITTFEGSIMNMSLQSFKKPPTWLSLWKGSNRCVLKTSFKFPMARESHVDKLVQIFCSCILKWEFAMLIKLNME